MSRLKKWITLAIAVAMMTSVTNPLQAANGGAYQGSSNASYVGPSIGLGAIVIASIIAIAVHNSKHNHAHS